MLRTAPGSSHLDGRWYAFDAQHNQRRIGRIVIARRRDAADVTITNAALAELYRRHLPYRERLGWAAPPLAKPPG
jgi:transglutaminase-like putative cysteine protease